jgi:hypothetical protein
MTALRGGRYIVQFLPVLLVAGILVVMSCTRLLQIIQSKVFHVLPFGALSPISLTDVCVGILVSGLFMLYVSCRVLWCSLWLHRSCFLVDLRRRSKK